MSVRKRADPAGSAWDVEVRELSLGDWVHVRRADQQLLDGGIADSQVHVQTSADALHFHVDVAARGMRLAALAENAADEPQLGDPTDVSIRFDGAWRRIASAVDIPEVQATVAGAAVSGSIALRDLDADAFVDLA
ncbi:MAG: hypothetical protein JOZ93_11220, partial [Sinobacteraceae bacterium]|nr:hypothetical protein [Nevskiaceae bacterium]